MRDVTWTRLLLHACGMTTAASAASALLTLDSALQLAISFVPAPKERMAYHAGELICDTCVVACVQCRCIGTCDTQGSSTLEHDCSCSNRASQAGLASNSLLTTSICIKDWQTPRLGPGQGRLTSLMVIHDHACRIECSQHSTGLNCLCATNQVTKQPFQPYLPPACVC